MAEPESLQETLEIDGIVYDNLLLVKAYDQAIRVTNKNLTPAKVDPDTEMPLSSPSTSAPKVPFKVGMSVQALYSEDQQYYEATIIKVFKTCCLVEFLGYKNKEKVPIKHIKESLGKEVQQKQIVEATAEIDELTEQETAPSSEIETDDMTECDSSQYFFRTPPTAPRFNPFKGGQPMIPPPIPPHIMNHFPQSESEIVSSMLLSWYMSGYHTGYWQGHHASKNHSIRSRLKSKKK